MTNPIRSHKHNSQPQSLGSGDHPQAENIILYYTVYLKLNWWLFTLKTLKESVKTGNRDVTLKQEIRLPCTLRNDKESFTGCTHHI